MDFEIQSASAKIDGEKSKITIENFFVCPVFGKILFSKQDNFYVHFPFFRHIFLLVIISIKKGRNAPIASLHNFTISIMLLNFLYFLVCFLYALLPL